ncbi:glycosyltransferase [Leifsonia sp. Leaf264]|uniref:glycosyltransferase n=1 Tax=Leifsonia sp. Leaf264 TaxID=1736314 RepID=UPI000700FB2B|nr:glycosyltransferase [Leifsonia sp. Leaf264]KQP01537.1 glucosaminyltransferase [Leifsonia sp. Leaf264]
MTADDWWTLLENVLVVILVIFVAVGVVPVVMMAYQFLLIPFHAVRNHYRKAAPYLPNVAVIVPAWNEGAVIGASIDRLMALEYPAGALRIYVVDDASTDDTPDVVKAKELQYPGSVVHLRRDVGGEGKAHTLNHGIRHVLSGDWMQALLIMDADVIYLPDSLRRMTRHLADERVGAVTAYIREGSREKNYLSRFIAFEYVLSQIGSRRAQNVLGALACLAGGAQLHSRVNLEAIGGAIDTSSLAEDTVTTFKTQLGGRRVVFEPYAVVLAEEPHQIGALWKQRLRWARGNVQLTKRYKNVWFRPKREHNLGNISFGLFWFSVFLLPVIMIASSTGLIGLYLIGSPLASTVFRALWIIAACTYVYTMILAAQLDPATGRSSWREAILFPGFVSILVMITAFFPGLLEVRIPALFGVTISDDALVVWTLFTYVWISAAMLAAWGTKWVDTTRAGRILSPLLVYLIGYGPILCAITFDSYIKEARGAAMVWDKTEKTGRVMG